MKRNFLVALGILSLAGSAMAGPHFGAYVNYRGGGYGCAPRYFAPTAYCAPRVVYYRPVPICYPPMVYAPVCAPVYRAPLFAGRVYVGPVAFGWRR